MAFWRSWIAILVISLLLRQFYPALALKSASAEMCLLFIRDTHLFFKIMLLPSFKALQFLFFFFLLFFFAKQLLFLDFPVGYFLIITILL